MAKIDDILGRFPGIAKDAATAIYKAGWDAAIAAMIQATVSVSADPPGLPTPPLRQRATPPTGDAERPNIDVTLEIIKAKPGLRGNGIIEQVRPHYPNADPKVIARTVRTSLSRLQHKRRAIYKREGKWYPKRETEAATA